MRRIATKYHHVAHPRRDEVRALVADQMLRGQHWTDMQRGRNALSSIETAAATAVVKCRNKMFARFYSLSLFLSWAFFWPSCFRVCLYAGIVAHGARREERKEEDQNMISIRVPSAFLCRPWHRAHIVCKLSSGRNSILSFRGIIYCIICNHRLSTIFASQQMTI